MGKAISLDLRERLVKGFEAGKSCRALAAQFEVAPSTAVRVVGRYKATGSAAPARQGRPKGSGKLAPFRTALIEQVKAKPDITMPALSSWLEQTHGVSATPSNLSKLLRAAGFSYKKNTAGLRAEAQRCQGRTG